MEVAEDVTLNSQQVCPSLMPVAPRVCTEAARSTEAAAGGDLHLQECKDLPSICTPGGLRQPKGCQRLTTSLLSPTKVVMKVNLASCVLLTLHIQT